MHIAVLSQGLLSRIVGRKCEIEHWLPCGADEQVYGHVITKFSLMGRFTYPWCSATRASRARAPLIIMYYFYRAIYIFRSVTLNTDCSIIYDMKILKHKADKKNCFKKYTFILGIMYTLFK